MVAFVPRISQKISLGSWWIIFKFNQVVQLSSRKFVESKLGQEIAKRKKLVPFAIIHAATTISSVAVNFTLEIDLAVNGKAEMIALMNISSLVLGVVANHLVDKYLEMIRPFTSLFIIGEVVGLTLILIYALNGSLVCAFIGDGLIVATSQVRITIVNPQIRYRAVNEALNEQQVAEEVQFSTYVIGLFAALAYVHLPLTWAILASALVKILIALWLFRLPLVTAKEEEKNEKNNAGLSRTTKLIILSSFGGALVAQSIITTRAAVGVNEPPLVATGFYVVIALTNLSAIFLALIKKSSRATYIVLLITRLMGSALMGTYVLALDQGGVVWVAFFLLYCGLQLERVPTEIISYSREPVKERVKNYKTRIYLIAGILVNSVFFVLFQWFPSYLPLLLSAMTIGPLLALALTIGYPRLFQTEIKPQKGEEPKRITT